MESFSPGVTTRLGIDYDTLKAINPRLVYCSITAYGRDGKWADRPGYDALVAARTGLQWEQRGWPQGALNHMAGVSDLFADIETRTSGCRAPPRLARCTRPPTGRASGAFFTASTAISAALRAREITGRGQWVETSLLQGAMACASGVWQRAEKIDVPMFNSWILGSRSPKGHFECSDGRWIHNWVPNPRFLLTAAAGDTLNASPDLKAQNDPDRFGTGPEELLVMMHYQPLLAEAVKKFPAKEWVDAAAVAGMTIQDVRTPEEALADPLFLKDGCVTELNDPELGPIRQVGVVYRMSANGHAVGKPAARVGEHTAQVKSEAAAAAKAPPLRAKGGRKLKAPLEGITVLDLGLAIAGPYGTQILSDLGAEVIKVNALYDTYWHRNHIAYICNRGKRSIALNLKDPRAMKILQQLVKKADVVQHNMRYEAAERLKIDYESLKAINPKLIYCHTRGFETGPRSGLPGNDQTGACLAGVQYEDGGMSRGGKPLWSFTSLGDTGNGFLSAIAILQALYHRERTGAGQFCDTSIVNAQLLNTSYAVARADGTGFERPRIDGMQLGRNALNRLYETRDGWLCLSVLREPEWQRFAAAMAGIGRRMRASPAPPRAQPTMPRWRSCWSRSSRNAPPRNGSRCSTRPACPAKSRTRSSRWAYMMTRSSRSAAGWFPTSIPSSASSIRLACRSSCRRHPAVYRGRPWWSGSTAARSWPSWATRREQIEELCKDCVLAWSLGEGHRKVRSPWQPQAPAAAAEQK